MYEIFPGNYAWSQAALRAMSVGGSPGDVLRAAERLADAAPGDTDAWHEVWSSIDAGSAARAEVQRNAGHVLSAAAGFLRAAVYMQWSVAFLAPSDARRPVGHRRSVALGAGDSQIPLVDAERLYAVARSKLKVLHIFTADEGGSAHCQNDNRVLAHEAIGDCLADVLGRR